MSASLANVTWPDAERGTQDAVLAVPLGSTEQHGPHLPLSTDTDIAVALAGALAHACPAVVVAPTVPYGSSGEHEDFAGTLSIGQEALELTLVELCRSASATFRRILLINGHGGNAEPLERARRRLRGEGRDVRAWAPSWAGDAHAGRTETSLMLALAPGQVRRDEARAGNLAPVAGLLPRLHADGLRAVSPNGVLGDPAGASAEEGHELLRAAVEELAAMVDAWPRLMTRVAVVTGAARGIGAATVRALAADGWAVIAVDACRDDPRLPYALGTEAELRAVVAEAADDARVTAVVADAADAVQLADAVALAERKHGALDAMIAAAGVIAGGVPLWEMPREQEDAVLEVDLRAVLTAARVAVPALLRRPQPRDARFIAVASTAATRGLPMLAAYTAAKAGVVGMVRALAAELGAAGVTANAVSPGSTRTAMLDESARLYGLDSPEAFAAQQPLERLLEPSEVAAMIAWLAGPAASGVTGAALAVDAGLSV